MTLMPYHWSYIAQILNHDIGHFTVGDFFIVIVGIGSYTITRSMQARIRNAHFANLNFGVMTILSLLALLLLTINLPITIIALISLWVGWLCAIYSIEDLIIMQFDRSRMIFNSSEDCNQVWNKKLVQAKAAQLLKRYYRDMAQHDAASIRQYAAPTLAEHATIFARMLQRRERKWRIYHIDIVSSNVISVLIDEKTQQGSVVLHMRGNATQTVTVRGKKIVHQPYALDEFWTLHCNGSEWRIQDISRKDIHPIDLSHLDTTVAGCKIYQTNSLLQALVPLSHAIIPKRTRHNAFAENHIIGQYGDIIFQLYTLFIHHKSTTATLATAGRNTWMVIEITLPRNSYDAYVLLLPRRQLSLAKIRVSGRTKLFTSSFERSKKVNAAFSAYSSSERLPYDHPILDPQLIMHIHSISPKTSIEITNNTCRIYQPILPTTPLKKYYQQHLALLQSLKQYGK